METRQAFLAAIRAKTDDDLPRLVYADFLDEQGENERAELIRLNVEYHQAENDPRWGREGAGWERMVGLFEWFLDGVGVKWDDIDGHTEFNRGFISRVRLPFSAWLTHAARILPESVGLTVRLTDRPQVWTRGLATTDDPTNLIDPLTYFRDVSTVPYQAGQLTVEEMLSKTWPEVQTWELPPEPTGGLIIPRSFLRELAARDPQAAADLVATGSIAFFGE